MINQGKTQKLDELVALVLKQMGLDRKFKECEVSELWPQVVGKLIASKTKNIYMTEGKLFVSFTSSVVKNEILMVKEGIIAALNDRLGEKVVKEMIIK
ncbi:hypothetical protein CE91St19_25740 [Odoribacter laneus]|jgi:hypothetical protein|uniref:DUF721 domain-containing protein n=1 Tax=Odoribacter laneus YIT 12061 TaxID=742817 RepID=H1DK67_9BACT|nr:DUF721 domain-containing protein [Odoribacter laneus]EHP45681.1 hypothetical protein HMPREF9449_02653 [Odoribacter laneus YIT 12061]GKI23172.1 hypothetical protein CE91St19_25740 [Odoribacter laneus]GKI26964.1 hypothetical protein CE91St20_31010 [Odoribacter laneus]CCZ80865.1 putative uncharacterized protein [Odoribacter laneus CAG:561]